MRISLDSFFIYSLLVSRRRLSLALDHRSLANLRFELRAGELRSTNFAELARGSQLKTHCSIPLASLSTSNSTAHPAHLALFSPDAHTPPCPAPSRTQARPVTTAFSQSVPARPFAPVCAARN